MEPHAVSAHQGGRSHTLVSRPIIYSNSTFRKYSNSVGSPKSETSVWYKLPPVKKDKVKITEANPDTLSLRKQTHQDTEGERGTASCRCIVLPTHSHREHPSCLVDTII